MSTHGVLLFFILIRLFDLVISFLASVFIPYLGFFPYTEILKNSSLPSFIYSFANFDGVHYIRTATIGYSQYAQAFFPLYPLLIRHVSFIFFINPIITGLIISYITFFIGLFVFNRYLISVGYKKSQIRWILLFLCLFPTSFFFGAVYNTSLFFCLAISALYFYKKKQYGLAGLFAVLSSLTRLEGVILVIPFILPLLFKKEHPINRRILFVISGPIIGLLIFMAFLWSTTGDPLFFLHSQPAFGANRSSSIVLLPQVLYRYLKIFVTANHDFRYFVSVFEFSIFIFVLGILAVDLLQIWKNRKKKLFIDELGLNLFSISTLVLPTLTGTLSSIPRYSLLAISMFIVLGKMQNRYVKATIAVIFSVIQIVVLMFFIQGYFVS